MKISRCLIEDLPSLLASADKLCSELAAGIARVRGAKRRGVRAVNWSRPT
jgi:hypothetical protein